MLSKTKTRLEKSDENLENTNIYDDDENHNENLKNKSNKNYFEEQDEIKKSLKNVVDKFAKESDEDEDFLQVKTKTKEEEEQEEADYIEWLKGKKEKIKDNELENSMVRTKINEKKNIFLSLRNTFTIIGMIQI